MRGVLNITRRESGFNRALALSAILIGSASWSCGSDGSGEDDIALPGGASSFLGPSLPAYKPLRVRLSPSYEPGSVFVILDGEPPDPPVAVNLRRGVYTDAQGRNAEPVVSAAASYGYRTLLPYVGDSRLLVRDRMATADSIVDSARVCSERCTMHVFYTDDFLWDTSDRTPFWEESPENWRTTTFEYTHQAALDASYLVSYDDATGEAVVALGTIVVDPTGPELSVSIESRNIEVYNPRHPLLSPPDVEDNTDMPSDMRPDVGRAGEE